MISPKLQRFRTKAESTLKLISDWIRRHWLFIFLALGGAFTAALVIRRKTNAVTTVDGALAVQRAKAKLLSLAKEQDELKARDATKVNEIFKLNGEIIAQQKVIAEATTGKDWKTLTDEELMHALKEAGL